MDSSRYTIDLPAREYQNRRRTDEILSHTAIHDDIDTSVYKLQPAFEEKGIDTSNFSIDEWLKIRRWAPSIVFDYDLDDEDEGARTLLVDFLQTMKELGKWLVIVWLLRKRAGDSLVAGEVVGDGSMVGNQNTAEVTKINHIYLNGTQIDEGSVRPYLVVLQPHGEGKILPLTEEYVTYNAELAGESIRKLDSGNPDTQIEGLFELRTNARRSEMERVIETITDPNPTVRKVAAETLAERDFQSAVPKLMECLTSTRLPYDAGEAITFSLLQLGDSKIIGFLAQIYATYENMEFLITPIKAACLGQEGKFKALLQAMRSEDKNTRLGAIYLVGEIFEENSKPMRSELLFN